MASDRKSSRKWKSFSNALVILGVITCASFVCQLYSQSPLPSSSSNIAASNTVNAGTITVQGNNSTNSTLINNSQNVSQVGSISSASGQTIFQQIILPPGSNYNTLTSLITNVPDTETRTLINHLESELAEATNKIELTKNDVALLIKSLRDLDRRTEAVQLLPDGRSKIGNAIVGEPILARREVFNGFFAFMSNDFQGALTNFAKATTLTHNAYIKEHFFKTINDGLPESKSFILLGMSIAEAGMSNNTLAKEYFRQSIEEPIDPTALIQAYSIVANTMTKAYKETNYPLALLYGTNFLNFYERMPISSHRYLQPVVLAPLYEAARDCAEHLGNKKLAALYAKKEAQTKK